MLSARMRLLNGDGTHETTHCPTSVAILISWQRNISYDIRIASDFDLTFRIRAYGQAWLKQSPAVDEVRSCGPV